MSSTLDLNKAVVESPQPVLSKKGRPKATKGKKKVLGVKATGGRGKRHNPQRKEVRAGIQFPITRIHRALKSVDRVTKVATLGAVYLGAVLEYLTAEVCELAGKACQDNHKKRITPRHIQLAIKTDEELNRLTKRVTVAEGGVVPYIHKVLLPKKGKADETEESNEEN